MAPAPPDFGPMFKAGTQYRWSGKENSVQEIQYAGELYLPSGRLVVCDPHWGERALNELTAFRVAVPAGRYPVSLAITRWDRSSGRNAERPMRLVAAVKLTVQEDAVASWETAQPENYPIEASTAHLFGVDSGTGCYIDASGVDALIRMGKPGGPIAKAEVDIYAQPSVSIEDHISGLNVVIFKCALGDGAYPTWLGRTADGEPACFVTNLQLLHSSLGPLPD